MNIISRCQTHFCLIPGGYDDRKYKFILQYLLPGGDDDQLGCTRYRRCWLRQQSSAGRGPLPYFTIASYSPDLPNV